MSLQSNIAHTVEGSQASKGAITYREALGRVYDMREAVATAQPYSASLVGVGEGFSFNQGILCYIQGSSLRVLNVREASEMEVVVNVGTLLELAERTASKYKLLNYSDGIATVLCQNDDEDPAWLLAIDVRRKIPQGQTRLRFSRRLRSTRRIFVRNNASYLYFGTHSALAGHGYREWVLVGYDLKASKFLNERPMQLDNFVGAEIGSGVCFEIKDGYFYAISNQNSFEDEEIDWTSYYICVRFPLSNPKDIQWQRIWRRQHREGPINDTWTNIALRADESTQQLVIVECRREWKNGGSENFRTYYSQPLDCFDPDPEPTDEVQPHDPNQPIARPLTPNSGLPKYLPVHTLPDEPLARTLTSASKPNYEPPKKRLRRHYHPEYTEEEAQSPLRHEFTLSKTKYHSYNLSASSFIDIVNDPPPQTRCFATPPDRLRLRVGSRKRKSPIDHDGEEVEAGLIYPCEHISEDGLPMESSEERFESRGVSLWPSNEAPSELLELLCPQTRAGMVEGASDERFMVYSTDYSSQEGSRAIILVSFDPAMGFRHLKRLGSDLPVSRRVGKYHTQDMASEPMVCDNGLDSSKDSASSSEPVWFNIEPASYLRLNKGYWLR